MEKVRIRDLAKELGMETSKEILAFLERIGAKGKSASSNLEGELIRRHDIDIPATNPLPATGEWFWDGTNENAELVANGVYIIQYNSGDTHKIRRVLLFKR